MQDKILVRRIKIGITFLIVLLLVATSVPSIRIITDTRDSSQGATTMYNGTYDFRNRTNFSLSQKIYNSKGSILNATEWSLQHAIWDLNSTSGGTVWLPPCNITLTTILRGINGLNIIGSGVNSTILFGRALDFNRKGNISIQSLKLDHSTTVGLNLSYTHMASVSNVYIRGTTYRAVDRFGARNTTFYNVPNGNTTNFVQIPTMQPAFPKLGQLWLNATTGKVAIYSLLGWTWNFSSSKGGAGGGGIGDGAGSITSANRATWNGTTKDVNTSRARWNYTNMSVWRFQALWNATGGTGNFAPNVTYVSNSRGYHFPFTNAGLQAAIYDLNATNGGWVVIPAGNLSITNTIWLTNNTRLQGGGMGITTLYLANSANVSMIRNRGGRTWWGSNNAPFKWDHDIEICSMTINSNCMHQTNPAGVPYWTATTQANFRHSVLFQGVNNSYIHDVYFVDSISSAIWISAGVGSRGYNVTIENCNFNGTARVYQGSGFTHWWANGITIDNMTRTNIHGCRMSYVYANGIVMQQVNTPATYNPNNYLNSSTITDCWIVDAQDGIYMETTHFCTIANCFISNCQRDNIYGDAWGIRFDVPTSHILIMYTTIRNCGELGGTGGNFKISGENNTLIGCVSNGSRGDGFFLSGTTGSFGNHTLIGCNVYGCADDGISNEGYQMNIQGCSIYDAPDAGISGNVITNRIGSISGNKIIRAGNHGIKLYQHNTTITGNTMWLCPIGIQVYGNYNAINDNIIIDSTNAGVYINGFNYARGHGCSIIGNVIKSTGTYGIRLGDYSSNSTVVGNVISGCTNGIHETSHTDNNTITSNNAQECTTPLTIVGQRDIVRDNLGYPTTFDAIARAGPNAGYAYFNDTTGKLGVYSTSLGRWVWDIAVRGGTVGDGAGSITSADRSNWNSSVRKLSFMAKWNGTSTKVNNSVLKTNRTIGFGTTWNNSVVKGNRTSGFGSKWNSSVTRLNNSSPKWNSSYAPNLTFITNSNGKKWTAVGTNIQLAIYDLNSTGGWVNLPPGLFILVNPIYIKRTIILEGSGANYTTSSGNGTAIDASAVSGDYAIVVGLSNSILYGAQLKNFELNGKALNTCSGGIKLLNCLFARIENVVVRSFTKITKPYGVGINITSTNTLGCYFNVLDSVFIYNCRNGTIIWGQTPIGYCSANYFLSGAICGDTGSIRNGTGVIIHNSDTNWFGAIDIEDWRPYGSTGLRIEGSGSRYNTFIGTRFENNNITVRLTSDSDGRNHFTNCFFNSSLIGHIYVQDFSLTRSSIFRDNYNWYAEYSGTCAIQLDTSFIKIAHNLSSKPNRAYVTPIGNATCRNGRSNFYLNYTDTYLWINVSGKLAHTCKFFWRVENITDARYQVQS